MTIEVWRTTLREERRDIELGGLVVRRIIYTDIEITKYYV